MYLLLSPFNKLGLITKLKIPRSPFSFIFKFKKMSIKKFVRKIKLPGIYTITVAKKEIRIVDREIFSTDDKNEIKCMSTDPEILALEKKDVKEKPAPKFKFDIKDKK